MREGHYGLVCSVKMISIEKSVNLRRKWVANDHDKQFTTITVENLTLKSFFETLGS